MIYQWMIASVLYYLGLKIINHFFKPEKEKDKNRTKMGLILACFGLLGILSPILGFVFALPAVLISGELISKDYYGRKRVVTFTWIVLIICVLSANLSYLLNP